MSGPSPYGPDRSLSIAIAVLIGGGFIVGATVYLLFTSAGSLADWHRTRLAEVQFKTEAPAEARRSARRRASTPPPRERPRRARPTPQTFGRLPALPKSNTPVAPPPSPTPELYDLNPDLSHANLGPAPNANSKPADRHLADNGSASVPSGTADMDRAPLSSTLNSRGPRKSTSWQSEASTIRRQVRALSSTLDHLGRTNKSAQQPSAEHTSASSSAPSGSSPNPRQRSSGSPPAPPDSPPQVPVDGGLGWLAAAGAAYAANRLRKRGDAEGTTPVP